MRPALKLEFHDFSFSLEHSRRLPRAWGLNSRLRRSSCTVQSCPRSPSFLIVSRNQASGRGSSCSVSSLKFALSRREQATAFSHSPRQDIWLQTERLLRLQTFVPHSQDSRLPSPENARYDGRAKRRGSPASEEARGCKRRSYLRTQQAVLSRQGRLNEVRCLR